jgi:hypothetical protein
LRLDQPTRRTKARDLTELLDANQSPLLTITMLAKEPGDRDAQVDGSQHQDAIIAGHGHISVQARDHLLQAAKEPLPAVTRDAIGFFCAEARLLHTHENAVVGWR